MKNSIDLRPTYWASVSGGKDSFYMLYLILNNLDKYPLDGVVYFDLEHDYPFIKDVIDLIENECKKHGIVMFRIKPRKKWMDFYNQIFSTGIKAMYPTRITRWCSTKYKADCSAQLNKMMKDQGKRVIYYIGFCADEERRFKFALNCRDVNVTQIYPLAELGIQESFILEWAKKQPIYNGYYKANRRCGCMGCPMSSINDLVYLKTHYPGQFDYFMRLAKETEIERERELGRPFSVWGDAKYNTDYKIRRVNQIISKKQLIGEQINLFDEDGK